MPKHRQLHVWEILIPDMRVSNFQYKLFHEKNRLNSQLQDIHYPVGVTKFLLLFAQDGGMATWSLQLHFQRGSLLDAPATTGKSGGTGWVTDFAALANCNKIVLSTTSRELVFGDVATPNFKCQYRVQGKP